MRLLSLSRFKYGTLTRSFSFDSLYLRAIYPALGSFSGLTQQDGPHWPMMNVQEGESSCRTQSIHMQEKKVGEINVQARSAVHHTDIQHNKSITKDMELL